MDEVDEVVGGGMQPLDGSEKYQWHAALVAEFDDHEYVCGGFRGVVSTSGCSDVVASLSVQILRWTS